jgi:hypothetical protein
MATTLAEIQGLLDEVKINYFTKQRSTTLLIPFQNGANQVHVLLAVQLEGELLQLRSTDLPWVTSETEHFGVLLEEMLALNFENKIFKVGRDPSDGELIAFADHVLEEDGQITTKQLECVLRVFVSSVAELQNRLKAAQDTGKTKHAVLIDRSMEELMSKCVLEHLEVLGGEQTAGDAQ